MTQDTTPTSGVAIQRYKIGYHADEWGQRSSTPSGIPDASGSWVRYADHVAALAAGQAVGSAEPDEAAPYCADTGPGNRHWNAPTALEALQAASKEMGIPLPVPAARPAPPAMAGGEDAEQERPVQRMEGWTDTRYIAELENVARLLRRDREKLHRVRDALSEKGGR